MNVVAAKRFAASCAKDSAKLLPHVSTRDSARDIDAIRAAIGEQRISYLGFSYGTYLGARYADMFPRRVRAMVLDGAVDPARSVHRHSGAASRGIRARAGRVLHGMPRRSRLRVRARGRSAAGVRITLARRRRRAASAKVHGERRILGPGEFEIGVASVLYAGDTGYRSLANALRRPRAGSVTRCWRTPTSTPAARPTAGTRTRPRRCTRSVASMRRRRARSPACTQSRHGPRVLRRTSVPRRCGSGCRARTGPCASGRRWLRSTAGGRRRSSWSAHR